MKFENFTTHAINRLKERTSMTPWELSQLLDKGAYLSLGSKPGINKEHLLFYSEIDDDCYVAVLDSINGGVITVWLKEYHENLCWVIADKQVEKAKELALTIGKYKEPLQAQSYWVSVGYLDENNNPKVQLLYKAPIVGFDWDAGGNKSELIKKLKEKKPAANDITWVSIRAGKTGDFTIIKF